MIEIFKKFKKHDTVLVKVQVGNRIEFKVYSYSEKGLIRDGTILVSNQKNIAYFPLEGTGFGYTSNDTKDLTKMIESLSMKDFEVKE